MHANVCLQMYVYKINLLFILLYSFFLSSSIYANGYKDHMLPRSYGPITLGMSVDAFKKAINRASGQLVDIDVSRCVHCGSDELYASFFISEKKAAHFRQQAIMLNSAFLIHQPTTLRPESVDCFFYKGKLYSISLNQVRSTIESVKSRYIEALGKPTAIDVWDTGLSQLRWENASTQLKVIYSTEEKGIDYITIEYTDRKILDQIPLEPENIEVKAKKEK